MVTRVVSAHAQGLETEQLPVAEAQSQSLSYTAGV